MGGSVRVIIADDQPISREGLQRIFERESDIEIVGVVRSAGDVLPQVREKTPDVLLLDLKWHLDDQAMNDVIAQLCRERPDISIVGLTAYEGLIKQAKAAGAKWAVTKDIGKGELVALIRAASGAVGPRELEKAESALRRLRGIKTGQQHATPYEKDVYIILKTVLRPHLTDPRFQARTFGGARRRDILFANYSSHPFWQRMSQRHDATLVIFEIKNTKRLDARYVDQMASYLTPGVGRLGFLVGRIPADESLIQHALNEFKNNRRVILSLCDDDLEALLVLKETKGEATGLIRKRYDDFMVLT